jgi:FlaA1/EpsC-like NDP-sugar epimerase
MIQNLTNLSRANKQILTILFDICAIMFAIIIAFSLRLGYFYFPTNSIHFILLVISSPILALTIFVQSGLYLQLLRYISFKGLWNIVQYASIYATIWGLIIFLAGINFVPRSVILINWVLVIFFIGGSRLFVSWLFTDLDIKKNVLIYGAGSAGRQLSNALKQSNEYNPIAFMDDSKDIYHHKINGLKVYAPDDLLNLIIKKNIREVLIALPSLSRTQRNKIINFLEPYSVIVRSLPGITEIVQGKVRMSDLLEIDLKKLLGREPAKINKNLFELNISNKVVMVTGAGGSIGSELCRQILLLKPKKIVLYELSESSLYMINQELNDKNIFNIEVFPVIGSVLDKERSLKILKYYGVQTIYHAAAYKHVPLVECNQAQGVFNNTIGTLILAKAAITSNVETFVLISTDKAVRPTNFMGASKRAAEMVLQALSKISHNTCFTTVRFGNVLDSSGSVIPLFKKQIKEGGPLTVTHIDIIRYFMTIPEAVELVIQSGAMAKGGEVFVLDMGSPIRIFDLAVKMISLSGLKLLDKNNPEGDIEIKFTGLRPGEKLYEELLIEGKFTPTENKQIMRAEEKMMSWETLEPILAKIYKKGTNIETEELYGLLKTIVPGFQSK